MIVHPFTVVESIHGRIIVNRNCAYQIDSLAKTGVPHIQREIEQILTIVASLPEGSVTVDAGANIGLISVPIASAVKAKGGVVLSFEPQQPLYHALCGTRVLNDLMNLNPYQMALGSAVGLIRMPVIDYSAPQDFGIVSLKDGTEDGSAVQITTIDSLGLPRLDLMKIDVEGFEVEVLAGARDTIRDNQPWCWIEYFLSDPFILKSQFAGLDYKFYRVDDQNMLAAPVTRLEASGIRIDAPDM